MEAADESDRLEHGWAVHEEVDKLPARFRAAVVLYSENIG